jgi:hypothetical protein
MSSQQPPAAATWLLDRFCADPGLAGDLIEEYRERQSSAWYWKQAVVAVSVYSTSQILQHKWLAVRAIATGWLFWFVVINMGMRGVVHPWLDTVAPRAVYPFVAYVVWLGNGWLIGRLHRPYSTAMVSAYALWLTGASVRPVYAAAMNALAGVDGSTTFTWELWSRAMTVVIIICGGTLCAYRDQVLAARRSRPAAGSVGRMSVAEG